MPVQLNEKVQKLTLEKSLLIKQLENRQKELEQLNKDHEEINLKYKTVSHNASSLLKTAKSEIARKNKTIQELRTQNDNLVFRKISSEEKERLRLRRSSSILLNTRRSSARSSIERRYNQRSRQHQRTPKKHVSLSSNYVNSKTIGSPIHMNDCETENKPSESNEVYKIKDKPQSAAISNSLPNEVRPSGNVQNECDHDHVKCVGNKDNDVCNENIPETKSQDENTLIDIVRQENVSNVDNNKECNKTNNRVYQPLQGPLTAYSVRMYKKLHGVSPPKVPSIIIENKHVSVNNELLKSSKSAIVNNEVTVTQNVDPLCKQQVQCINPREKILNEVSEEKDHVTELTQVANNDKLEDNISLPKLLKQKEFSKSHHKRPYAVSSPKIPLKYLSKTQFNTNSPKIIERENDMACEVKTPNITLKLQEKVKEFIKLGTNINNNKSRNTLNNLKQTPSPIKKELLKNRSPEQLIIQCDLRQQNTLKEKCNSSPNVVSINETIGNIFKNQKAGMYNSSGKSRSDSAELPSKDINVANPDSVISNNIDRIQYIKKSAKNVSVQKQNGSFNPTSMIKKPIKKPVIAPVTFGNRILSEFPLSKKHDTYNKYFEKKCSINQPDNSALDYKPSLKTQPPKLAEDIVSSRKCKVLTSLFGESPMKLVKEDEVTKTDELVSPLSLRYSPILPDSSSLDSDNTEDLVIDTTACSLNTSPRVSESDNKDELDNLHNLQTLSTPIKNTEIITNNLEIKISDNFQNIDDKKTVQEGNQELITCNHNVADNVNDTNKVHVNKSYPCYENMVNIQVASDAILTECVSDKNDDKPLSNSDIKNVDTYKSSTNDLGKPTSPEISIESVQSISEECIYHNDNKNKSSIHNRFVPSPPQLTLVSAFRHSENSVFKIAEDTVGFVSALTRVRDISPIRTPDKKNMRKPEVPNIPETEDIEPKIDCFIIRANPDITNSTEIQIITKSSGISNIDLNKSFEINSNQNTNIEKELIENKNKKNGSNEQIIEIQKETVCVNNNRFRRSRPVRQLTISQPSNTSKLSNKENINFDIISSPILTTKNELNIENINKNEPSKKSVIHVLPDTEFKSKLDKSSDSIVDYPKCSSNVNKTQPKILVNNISGSTNCSLPFATASINDNETIKTYKRSESLKMLKHTPKINKAVKDFKIYNQSCDNLKLEHKLNSISQPKVEIRVNQLIKNTSQFVDKDKEELNKLPHIASINQRIRISKYQGGKDKPVNILAAEVNSVKNTNEKMQDTSRISMGNLQAHKNQEMSSVEITSTDLNIHKQNLIPPHSKSPKSTLKHSLQSSIKGRLRKPMLDDKMKTADAATMLQCSKSVYNSSAGAISESKTLVNKQPTKSINKATSPAIKHDCKGQQFQNTIPQYNHKSVTNQPIRPLNKLPSAAANVNCSSSLQNKTLKINHEKDLPSSTINKSRCKSPLTSNNTSLVRSPENKQTSDKKAYRRSQSSSPESRHKGHGRSSSNRYRSPHRRSRYRSKRSKSMSPHFVRQSRFNSRFDYYHNRDDRRIRQHRKRSRSRSYEHYRSKSSGNPIKRCINYREFDFKKSSDKISNVKEGQNKSKIALKEYESVTIPLKYSEELEQLKEELSLVKSKLKEKEKTQDYLLNTPLLNTQQTGVKRQLESLSNDKSEVTKRIKMTYDNEESNQHVVKDLNLENNCNRDREDNTCVKELNTSLMFSEESPINLETTINTKPVNVIKLKRRSRNLGDSEVKVVSFDSCGLSITKNRNNLSIG